MITCRQNMKWIFVFFITITLFCVTILPVSGADQKPTAMVAEFSINPPVLTPNEFGIITVIIREIGTVSESKSLDDEESSTSNTTTWDDTVIIERVSLEGNGILVLSPVYYSMGQLGSERSLPLTFLVRAPAKSGIYYPEVWMDTDGGPSRFPITVNVNTAIGTQKQAIIILNNSYPEKVKPGDEIPVRVTVRNDGLTLADDMTLTFDVNYPGIAPITSNRYYLGGINAGEEKSADIVFISDEKTDPGLHKIPVTIQYTLIGGGVQTENASVNVVTKGSAEMGFVSVNTTPSLVTAGQPFDIIIRIGNAGTGPAKQVFTAVDLPMTGTRQSYLGTIEPGDDAPAIFLITSGAEGSYLYNATITYEDDTGSHSEVRQMALRINPDPTLWIKILILLILSGVIGIVGHHWYLAKKSGTGAFPWIKKN